MDKFNNKRNCQIDEIEKDRKDCTDCVYFEIETFYGVCNKHCGMLNNVKPCEDFEEDS